VLHDTRPSSKAVQGNQDFRTAVARQAGAGRLRILYEIRQHQERVPSLKGSLDRVYTATVYPHVMPKRRQTRTNRPLEGYSFGKHVLIYCASVR